MTIQSDLDLVFVYGVSDAEEESDGFSSQAASPYFAKLGKQLILALSTPAGSGRLFDVDTRLRPFGQSGPSAASHPAFRQYYRQDAWTWEHMALSRARVIAGDEDLGEQVTGDIRSILSTPRDPAKLLVDVADMRKRIATQHANTHPWEVKHRRGGLVDIEFLAQYLQLQHASAEPNVMSTSTLAALMRLREHGCLENADATTLIEALSFWQRAQGNFRTLLWHSQSSQSEEQLFDQVIDQLTSLPTTDGRERHANAIAQSVMEIFHRKCT